MNTAIIFPFSIRTDLCKTTLSRASFPSSQTCPISLSLSLFKLGSWSACSWKFDSLSLYTCSLRSQQLLRRLSAAEMEPDVSIETSCMIRVAILPIGPIPGSHFRDYASMLVRHHKIELSSISSFYAEHQKSPFAHQPWDSGSLRFKFMVGGSPPSPWEDFQSHRKILAVIGICHCPSSPDLESVIEQFSVTCKGYASSLVQRCFAFFPGDSQVRFS